jgi:uncharacterized SAM-binding protein YcdF (DUF218 family)
MIEKKQVLAITKWGMLATTLWLGLVGLEIVRFASIRAQQSADAAIVLGAAVVDNRPSPVFQARVDHAIDLWKNKRIKYLIFTGGLGAGDTLTESQAAKQYAVTQGVPPDRIFIELKSRTTKQNLLEAQKILQTQQLSSCLLVSDPLHMKRADWMMRDVGIKGYPSPTPYSRYRTWQSQLPFLVREVYFYHHYWLFRQ